MFTWGEGWHNNHHAHPSSARHGLAWYEIDINWYGIWMLKKLGLAKDVYRYQLAPKEQERAAELEAAADQRAKELVSA